MAPVSSGAIRALVVVEHPILLLGLKVVLEQSQVEVAGATSTITEALSLAAHTRPDVTLLDLDFDSRNAIEAIPDLIQHGATRIVGYTQSSEPGFHDAAVMAGVRGICAKHETPNILSRAIDRVHRGELWLDRSSTARVFMSLTRHATDGGEHDERSKIATLTKREREVVRIITLAPASSVKVIAYANHMSEKTLRNHLTGVYSKLGVNGRLELHVFARRYKLDAQAPATRPALRHSAPQAIAA